MMKKSSSLSFSMTTLSSNIPQHLTCKILLWQVSNNYRENCSSVQLYVHANLTMVLLHIPLEGSKKKKRLHKTHSDAMKYPNSMWTSMLTRSLSQWWVDLSCAPSVLLALTPVPLTQLDDLFVLGLDPYPFPFLKNLVVKVLIKICKHLWVPCRDMPPLKGNQWVTKEQVLPLFIRLWSALYLNSWFIVSGICHLSCCNYFLQCNNTERNYVT